MVMAQQIQNLKKEKIAIFQLTSGSLPPSVLYKSDEKLKILSFPSQPSTAVSIFCFPLSSRNDQAP